MNPSDELNQIALEVTSCENCKLHLSRHRSVPGEGPANTQIMFIGEGPGFNENEQGRPFVGQAGKFLDELLGKAGLKRPEVFICNVVKCRPPENRDPEPDEIAACGKFLDRQIQTINPQIIVTLGRISMGKFLPGVKISAIHGRAMRVNGRVVVAMYHPAAALHQPALRSTIENDFSRLPNLFAKLNEMGNPEPAPAPEKAPELPQEPEPPEAPAQLSLF
jgi:DNA polymerase